MSKKPTASKLRRRQARLAEIQAASRLDSVLYSLGEVEISAGSKADDGSLTPSKFTMLAYSGGKFSPSGWWGDAPLVMNLDGMQVDASIPIHRDHDNGQIVGHSSSVKVAAGKLVIDGVISAVNAHADEVVASSKQGFPWQASIGAKLLKAPEFVAAGTTVQVNGRRIAGPVYVANKWQLKESSFVSLGADSRTTAVAANERKPMNEFEKWLAAKGWNAEDLSDEQTAFLKAQFDREQTPAEDSELEAEDKIDSMLDIQAQLAEARKLMAAELKRTANIQAKLGSHPELAAKAVEENWSEDKIELEAMRAERSRGPAIHSRSRDLTGNALEARIVRDYISSQLAEKSYTEKDLEASDKLEAHSGFRGLFGTLLRADGLQAPDSQEARVSAIFDRERNLRAAGGFSTISLATTLSNAANKALLAGYDSITSVVSRFCSEVDKPDFKQSTVTRLSSPGFLEALSAAGEIQHTEIDEDGYTNQVTTFARMISLTRTMMINDDLGAFLRNVTLLGGMALKTRERAVFSNLLDNTSSFFNATATVAANGYLPNAATGATTALSATSLGTAEKLFLKQVDKHGNPIMITPGILLVPTAIYRDAVNLTSRTTVTVAGDPASTKQLRVGDEFAGQFEPLTSAWLGTAAGLTSASDTAWYLFADPNAGVAAMEIAYLQGKRRPTVQSAETDFSTLGMQWRCYWDFGVAKQDPRGAVRMAGA